MSNQTPVIEIDQLVRRYGRTEAVNGLDLRVEPRTLLWFLRTKRRRQDNDDQVPAKAPAALSLIMLIPLLGDVVLWAARHVGIRPSTYLFGLEPTSVIAFIVFSFLIAFGLPNYRTSDRSSIRIWRQLLWLCGSVICIMFVALIARSALGLAIIRD